MTVFVILEEYYGDPGPPSYNVIGVYRSEEGARAEIVSLKTFPMNKMCSYSIFAYDLED